MTLNVRMVGLAVASFAVFVFVVASLALLWAPPAVPSIACANGDTLYIDQGTGTFWRVYASGRRQGTPQLMSDGLLTADRELCLETPATVTP